jgi:predicted dehydrogenase
MTEPAIPFGDYSALVVGSGSIGRRHMANLRQLGIGRLAAVDSDIERLKTASAESGAQTFSDAAQALQQFQPQMVFVCTPPASHVEHALHAIRSGADVFIEKPLSHRMEGVHALMDAASQFERVVQVGYNLRFHPAIKELKKLVDQGVAGRIFWARAEVAQYLPEWRPWQDYRQSYTARRELGGGIILDASHEIDYMLWLLGPVKELACMAGQVSGLDVSVEDCATILLRMQSGAQADIHMDFAQRVATRTCVLAGELATLEWRNSASLIRILRPNVAPEVVRYDFEANQMYVSEVEEFFSAVRQRRTANQSLASSQLTLQIALAALSAASDRKWVAFG